MQAVKILEELWYGNIITQDRYIPPNSQISKLISLVARNEEKLVSLLSDEAKTEFEKMKDNQSELSDLSEREMFISGFKLGARIMLEVMDETNAPSIDE